MPTILDLPQEILLTVVEHLPGNSIKNTILTCRYFHSVLEGSLYRWIDWNHEPYDYPRIPNLGYTGGANLERLMSRLQENSALAKNPRYVRMVSWKVRLQPTFFCQLNNLRHLRFEGEWLSSITRDVPILPHLETVYVNSRRYGINRIWILPLADQPNLRQLTLIDINGAIDERFRPQLRHPYPKPFLEPNVQFLSESMLQHVLIECLDLRSMFHTWSDVEWFVLSQTPRYEYSTLRVSFINSSHVPTTQNRPFCRLEYRRGNIMTLELDPEQFGRSCKLNMLSALESLAKLRRLEIDPVVCMGRRNCELAPRSCQQPKIRGFADQLPNNIGELTILIDLEQSARIQYYRSELVDSVIQARKKQRRFPRLTKIVFIEHTEYASGHRCWGEDPFCCYGSLFGWNDSEMLAGEFELIKHACEEVGISVECQDDAFYRDKGVKPSFLSD